MIKNLKIYKQATALLLSATCLMTAGCSTSPNEDPNLETSSSYCEITPETPDNSITENDTQQDDVITKDEFNLDDENLTQEELETLKQLINLSKKITQGKETAKQALRDLTDFFFNGKEINGVTFEELSDNAKAIAIKCFETIVTAVKGADAAIEEQYPNYKENIGKKANELAKAAIKGLGDLTIFAIKKGGEFAGNVKDYIAEGAENNEKVLTK